MEALSHSVALADLVQKCSAARWTGCSARAFAEAVVAKLEWLCKTESYVADVLGKKAQVKAQYDRAVAANAQCQRGMEVQACEEYGRLHLRTTSRAPGGWRPVTRARLAPVFGVRT